MDPKLELTKSQLETILRLINDVNLNGDKGTSVNKLASSSNEKQTKRVTSLSRKRSYSAVNLKNAALLDRPSDHQLINESFRKSIASLMAKNETHVRVNKANRTNDSQPVKLKRNKSLIELKREKWDRERDELKDSESWYEKFDSFKKQPFSDRSKSQPDIHLNTNFEDNLHFHRSVSRLFSPVSNFDDESIALSASYTALQSPEKVASPPNGRLPASPEETRDRLVVHSMNRSSTDHSLVRSTSRSTNEPFNTNRRSFRRYAHQANNVNILEKRRKQQEYKAELEAQLAQKRQATKLRNEQQMLEDRAFEAKLASEQQMLRKEFELEHKNEELVNGNGITWTVSKREEPAKGGSRRERKPTSELERLETKSKELVKMFKDQGTQTEAGSSSEHMLVNKWQTTSGMQHSILQPVQSNRSAKPKWITKQQSKRDTTTVLLPKLTTSQKANQVLVRKRWNS